MYTHVYVIFSGWEATGTVGPIVDPRARALLEYDILYNKLLSYDIL